MTGPVATLWSKPGADNLLTFTSHACTPSGTRAGLVVTHGATVLADVFVQTGLYWQPVANAALGGYTSMCADAGGASTFGNDASISAVTAAVAVLQAAPYSAKAGKVWGYGGSMGAIVLLNHARANPGMWAGLFLTVPLLDLDDMYQNDKGGFRASIGTAYGVAYPTAIPNLATHSPAAYSNASLAAMSAVPIQLWASTNDPLASTYASCQTWAANANAQGMSVTVSSLGAAGHSAAGLDPLALVQWLDTHGGRT